MASFREWCHTYISVPLSFPHHLGFLGDAVSVTPSREGEALGPPTQLVFFDQAVVTLVQTADAAKADRLGRALGQALLRMFETADRDEACAMLHVDATTLRQHLGPLGLQTAMPRVR